MADKSPIEWTDATWNPVRGCSRVSAGCMNCYAEGVAARFAGPDQPFEGLAVRTSQGPKWTGQVRLVPELLETPLHWRKPRMIFVNSMSDLFHEEVPLLFIAHVFAIMTCAGWHTFQVLTKRAARMREVLTSREFNQAWRDECGRLSMEHKNAHAPHIPGDDGYEPRRNIQLGVSVEDQPNADERIPHLLATPAAVRFVSVEPMLGRIRLDAITNRAPPPQPGQVRDIDPWDEHNALSGVGVSKMGFERTGGPKLDWVIAGGESGPGARPVHPLWIKSLRDQCEAARVPFFFKQWGEWGPSEQVALAAPGRAFEADAMRYANLDGTFSPVGIGHPRKPGCPTLIRAGKKVTGRLLDGRLHDEFPGATT
ncbi:MAG TPA: phage Gp37/Gp68 family protein [Ramlibacter sp.]|nr:phage Gp37/Gp68 family protein [Ramlibacter sp.]